MDADYRDKSYLELLDLDLEKQIKSLPLLHNKIPQQKNFGHSHYILFHLKNRLKINALRNLANHFNNLKL